MKRRLQDTWTIIQFAVLATFSIWTHKAMMSWDRHYKRICITYLNHLFSDELPEEFKQINPRLPEL